MTTRQNKCPCGRGLSAKPAGANAEFVICRVCYEKLPPRLKERLRFRGGHVAQQNYKLFQKWARDYVRENLR